MCRCGSRRATRGFARRRCTVGARWPVAGASCCPTPMRGRKSGVRVTSSLPLVETAAMNASDLAEYCRKRGLFAEQIRAWRVACAPANDWDRASCAKPEPGDEGREQAHQGAGTRPAAQGEGPGGGRGVAGADNKSRGDPKGRSGRMISAPDRHRAVALIDEATAASARRFKACAELRISDRTCRRWTAEGAVRADQRPDAPRPAPPSRATAGTAPAGATTCRRPDSPPRRSPAPTSPSDANANAAAGPMPSPDPSSAKCGDPGCARMPA